MRSSIGLPELREVFFTHFHADHYLGLPGMLKTFSLRGRTELLTIYGPRGLRRFLSDQASIFGIGNLTYPYELRELDPGDELDRGDYRLIAFPVRHRVRALGYALEERPRPGRFDVEAADALGVPPPRRGQLQRGGAVELADGRTVVPDQGLGPARPSSSRAARSPPARPSPYHRRDDAHGPGRGRGRRRGSRGAPGDPALGRDQRRALERARGPADGARAGIVPRGGAGRDRSDDRAGRPDRRRLTPFRTTGSAPRATTSSARPTMAGGSSSTCSSARATSGDAGFSTSAAGPAAWRRRWPSALARGSGPSTHRPRCSPSLGADHRRESPSSRPSRRACRSGMPGSTGRSRRSSSTSSTGLARSRRSGASCGPRGASSWPRSTRPTCTATG